MRASTSARARLTISSRMRSRSVSPPTRMGDLGGGLQPPDGALEIVAVVVEVSYRRAFSIATAAQSASTTSDSSSAASNGPSPVGQVEVAPGLAADQDRSAQEGRHRGVAGREPVAPRVGVQAVQPQRLGAADQLSKEPRPRGRSPIVAPRLLVDPGGDEPLQLACRRARTPRPRSGPRSVRGPPGGRGRNRASGSSSDTRPRPTSSSPYNRRSIEGGTPHREEPRSLPVPLPGGAQTRAPRGMGPALPPRPSRLRATAGTRRPRTRSPCRPRPAR